MGTQSWGVSGSMSRGDGGAQAESRDYERKRDQHSRVWGYNVEGVGKNRGRCGPLELHAPRSVADRPFPADPRLRPPDKFVREGFAPNEVGEEYLRQARVFVDYAGWKQDIRRGWTEFVKLVREEYAKRDLLCDWTPGGAVPMRLDVRDKVGVDPSPIEIPMACEQGNLWALHGIGPMPKALVKYFGAPTRLNNVLGAMESITFEEPATVDEEALPEVEENTLADLEEQFDAEATGGTVAPVRVNPPLKDEHNAKPHTPKSHKKKPTVTTE